jgi:DNA-binding response OmpR family regulator
MSKTELALCGCASRIRELEALNAELEETVRQLRAEFTGGDMVHQLMLRFGLSRIKASLLGAMIQRPLLSFEAARLFLTCGRSDDLADSAARVHIFQLRRKLAANAGAPKILMVRGGGWLIDLAERQRLRAEIAQANSAQGGIEHG